MRIGMLLAALTCFGLGILPTVFIDWMDIIAEQLIGTTIASSAGRYGWMWLTPVSYERASYSGFIVFVGILAGFRHRIHASSCQAGHYTPGANLGLRLREDQSADAVQRDLLFHADTKNIRFSLQYPGAGGSWPRRPVITAFPKKLQYHLSIRDRFWGWLYKPVVDASLLDVAQGRKAPAGTHPGISYLFVCNDHSTAGISYDEPEPIYYRDFCRFLSFWGLRPPLQAG